MPTPLVHLFLAQRILEDGASAAIAPCLAPHAGAFLLGSIAPDAWCLGCRTREETHILPIPVPQGRQGARELLDAYPELRVPAHLRPAQAAFVAGYMTHLTLDEIWYHRIFAPYYLQAGGDEAARRFVLHNVLRVYMEDQLETSIDPACVRTLQEARTDYGLPLFPDETLRRWRDLIGDELRPDTPRRSVEVFAGRLHIPASEMSSLLADPAALQREVLGRLPPGLTDAVLEAGIRDGAHQVRAYLSGRVTADRDDGQPVRGPGSGAEQARRREEGHARSMP